MNRTNFLRYRRRLGILFTVACGLILTGCAREQYRLQNPAAAGQIAWGKPADGLQAGLSVDSASGSERPVVHATVYLKNISASPLRLLAPANYYPDPAGLGSAFEVSDNGEPLAKLHKGLQPVPPASAFITLGPGQVVSAKKDVQPEYWSKVTPHEAPEQRAMPDPEAPPTGLSGPVTLELTFVYTGRYEVQRQSDTGLTLSSGDTTGLWTGDIRSAPVTARLAKAVGRGGNAE